MKRREFMKRSAAVGAGLALRNNLPLTLRAKPVGRIQQDFSSGWRFIRSAVDGGGEPGIDDSQWNLVALPHTARVEALTTGKLGTATVTVHELRRSAQLSQDAGFGELSQEQLKIAVEDARSHGERIVMTNGCFDILHAGHVSYLSNARRMGDRLIVAVNDDESVGRLKGTGRPINSASQRMAVLAALECVDWVVPFSEDTPEQLICDIRPDYLVKGGDYRAEDVAGYDCVRKNGGDVVILDYQDGCSTSEIIRTIRRSE